MRGGATLDLISVDLYTGTARLFKAGAAPGFLVHGGRARPVGDASLPIGILGGVNGQSRVVHLAAGDYAVLVSDGLLVDGTGWVLKQLELLPQPTRPRSAGQNAGGNGPRPRRGDRPTRRHHRSRAPAGSLRALIYSQIGTIITLSFL